MSSHHFVKEGQEAALVIMDAVSYETIAPVLEWSPLVIVFQKALEEVLTWSIKIDVVVCLETDRERMASLLQEQFPLEIVTVASWELATETILAKLISESHHNMVIATRDVEAVMSQVEDVRTIRISLLAPDGLKWSLYFHGTFEKWMPKNEAVRVKGSINEMENATRRGDGFIATNEGIMKLKNNGPFWVAEYF
jgi:hypothetical protein